uniref:Nucleotide-diphospho-sugar transferase domain-containing protein n=1 Tax=Guillardia theta TaxID=55529 RepID=A0A7S4MZ01_GUITH
MGILIIDVGMVKEGRGEAGAVEEARELLGMSDADGDMKWQGSACCPLGRRIGAMSACEMREWLICINAVRWDEDVPVMPNETGTLKEDELVRRGIRMEGARSIVACRNFTTHGVLYALYNLGGGESDKMTSMVRRSILSLKQLQRNRMLGVHVAIAGKEGAESIGALVGMEKLGVQFSFHPDAESSTTFKISAMLASPFQHTMFLDADTYVCRDVLGAFDLLPRFDLVATEAPILFHEGHPTGLARFSIPSSYAQFNSAVVLFASNERLTRLLRLALERGRQLQPLGFYDQEALRFALWNSPDVRTHTLPPPWQCRGATTCSDLVAGQVIVGQPVDAGFFPCVVLHSRKVREEVDETFAVSCSEGATADVDRLGADSLLPCGGPRRGGEPKGGGGGSF